uniref:Protein-L-isoaspartate O-methyltransferase domain-containing protein 1 n=2 Tax=Timema TaxID=61471 RepID=A0A7R9E724_9NEOP|nr:unnamed protein product [Timema cristinae]CAD7428655.1 unnamed protein product [Timema monikensis]
MGGAVSAGEDNDDLVDNLLEADYIKTACVERVFRSVDRAHYFTPEFRDNAYKDLAWKNGNLHLSAPCIYSEVMESLQLASGLSFLNLGSGTGYLSTMAGLILGPRGVNHGIEIHEDVVEYAIKKLEEFKKISPALDEYELCEPRFIKGNCLSLNSDVLQYDRVYCGASCPENHENYMKNLIKVGGILVMPLNDQLLQIVRSSETEWEIKSVLPVSFASLLLPDQPQGKENIVLPENEPLSLQDACRYSIRTILRQNIESENPCLKTKHRPPKRKMKRRAIRRMVIPIFEESDDEEVGFIVSDDEDHGDGTHNVSARAGLLYNTQHEHTGHISAVLELARSLVRHRTHTSRSSDSGEEGGAEDSSTTIAEQRKKIPKREKFDSGIGDEIENGKGLSSDSEGDDNSTNMEVDSDSDTFSKMCQEWWDLKKQTVTIEDPNEDMQVDKEKMLPLEVTQTLENEINETSQRQQGPSSEGSNIYSICMRSKIKALPLPLLLKDYLNFYRSF